MILLFLRDWADRKSAKLNNLSISSEIFSREFKDDKFEMEVVHIGTEELIYWKYLEKIDSNTDLDEITSDYFQVLQRGLKL
ncbi:4'-phosphopantetheinyl transferase [Brevibacillus sp. IT-7CA2]|uniref:hypothetical protein n=1 Tax=Brevibacillus sp. IT-7CA2 TaxID=3026436 RepID=UPI0039E1917C